MDTQRIWLAVLVFPEDRLPLIVDCDTSRRHLAQSFDSRIHRRLYPEATLRIVPHDIDSTTLLER